MLAIYNFLSLEKSHKLLLPLANSVQHTAILIKSFFPILCQYL